MEGVCEALRQGTKHEYLDGDMLYLWHKNAPRDLSDVEILDLVAAVTAANEASPGKIRQVYLKRCSDDQAKLWARLCGVERFSLQGSFDMGDAGAEALAESEFSILDLQGQRIGDVGAVALAYASPAKKEMNLRGNPIASVGLYELQQRAKLVPGADWEADGSYRDGLGTLSVWLHLHAPKFAIASLFLEISQLLAFSLLVDQPQDVTDSTWGEVPSLFAWSHLEVPGIGFKFKFWFGVAFLLAFLVTLSSVPGYPLFSQWLTKWQYPLLRYVRDKQLGAEQSGLELNRVSPRVRHEVFVTTLLRGAISAISWLGSVGLFIPLLRIAVSVFLCDDATGTLIADASIVCNQAEHTAMLALTVVLSIPYSVMALRLAGVGGMIHTLAPAQFRKDDNNNIHLRDDWSWLSGWSNDTRATPQRHAFALHPKSVRLLRGVFIVKVFLVLISLLLDDPNTMLSLMLVATGITTVAVVIRPQHVNTDVSDVRAALYAGSVYTAAYAMAIRSSTVPDTLGIAYLASVIPAVGAVFATLHFGRRFLASRSS